MTVILDRTLTIAILLVLAAAAPLPPARAQDNPIQLVDPWARRAPAMAAGQGGMGAGHGGASAGQSSMGPGPGGAGNGAVYVKVVNRGAAADAVVSAASDAAQKVELHEVINDQGVMRMRPMTKIDVPAHGTLEMKPGGYHIMLLGLTRDLKPGDRVKVTVTLEKAGPMVMEAPVR